MLFLVRKRGRPRGRGRGPGRPRGSRSGRGRRYSRSTPDYSSLVKVELDDSPSPEEASHEVDEDHTVFTAIKSPPVLKTIKKEDIMISVSIHESLCICGFSCIYTFVLVRLNKYKYSAIIMLRRIRQWYAGMLLRICN